MVKLRGGPAAGMWRVMAAIAEPASAVPPDGQALQGAKGAGSKGRRRLTQIHQPVEHDGDAKEWVSGADSVGVC